MHACLHCNTKYGGMHVYALFMKESWDNIGSSRMAYDMSHNEVFPENEVSHSPGMHDCTRV